MTLDLASVLLQWGVGILAFLWVTTRGRLVSLGYGWLLRGVGALMLGGSLWALLARDATSTARTVTAGATAVAVLAALVALAVSVVRREAGVRAARERAAARAERVAAMAGGAVGDAVATDDPTPTATSPEFPPALDLAAPVAGVVALLACAATLGGPYALTAYRLVVGAAFLGVLTDAMLLGHWYLTQPGLPREPIRELVKWAAPVWVLEVIGLLWPVGMISVLNGSISDGYGGILAWMWALSAASTGVLILVTWLALKERSYSAVMAATGLLYLAILTGFGTDVLARALLAP